VYPWLFPGRILEEITALIRADTETRFWHTLHTIPCTEFGWTGCIPHSYTSCSMSVHKILLLLRVGLDKLDLMALFLSHIHLWFTNTWGETCLEHKQAQQQWIRSAYGDHIQWRIYSLCGHLHLSSGKVLAHMNITWTFLNTDSLCNNKIEAVLSDWYNVCHTPGAMMVCSALSARSVPRSVPCGQAYRPVRIDCKGTMP